MIRNKIFWLVALAWPVVSACVVVAVLWVVVFSFMTRTTTAQVSRSHPRRGEWLCWVTNVKAECGTYGWHKRKQIALRTAMDLCEKTCGKDCAEDYCEVVK